MPDQSNGRSLKRKLSVDPGHFLLPIAIFILTLGASLRAQAQNVFEGETIARTWCSSCHVIGPKYERRNDWGGPSFMSIARMPSTTDTSIAVFLSTPHEGMPNYSLSRAEIHDVAAYIMTLRKAK